MTDVPGKTDTVRVGDWSGPALDVWRAACQRASIGVWHGSMRQTGPVEYRKVPDEHFSLMHRIAMGIYVGAVGARPGEGWRFAPYGDHECDDTLFRAVWLSGGGGHGAGPGQQALDRVLGAMLSGAELLAARGALNAVLYSEPNFTDDDKAELAATILYLLENDGEAPPAVNGDAGAKARHREGGTARKRRRAGKRPRRPG